MSNNDNRGLTSADEKTRKRVASEGGSAPHIERGLEAADEETRQRVAREKVEKHLTVVEEKAINKITKNKKKEKDINLPF